MLKHLDCPPFLFVAELSLSAPTEVEDCASKPGLRRGRLRTLEHEVNILVKSLPIVIG